MTAWREMSLGDFLTLQRGFDLPARDRIDGPYPIVSSSGITGRHAVARVDPPGVVIGRTGTLGSVYWVTDPYWPHNTALWVRDFKGNSPRFASYLLQTIRPGGSSASAVPGVNRNHLHTLPIRVPGLSIQQRIAAVLEAFDEIIEMNERRIDLLDGIARSLYREWFVRFRFPGASAGGLTDSEVGSIPVGWSVGSLGSVCSFIQAGNTPRRSDATNWTSGTVDWFTTGELKDGPLVTSEERAVAKPALRVVEPPMILMAIYGAPTVGRLGWVTRACSCNQAALALRANHTPSAQEWLWHVLITLRPRFNAMAQGAAQQNISKEKVASVPIAIPPSEVMTRFAERVAPLRASAYALDGENRVLARIRELLLPRLVTGRLDISDIDLGELLAEDPNS